MLRLNSNGSPEFYFDADASTHYGYSISVEEMFLLAREARTINELRLKLIMEAVNTVSEHKQTYDAGARKKAAGV